MSREEFLTEYGQVDSIAYYINGEWVNHENVGK